MTIFIDCSYDSSLHGVLQRIVISTWACRGRVYIMQVMGTNPINSVSISSNKHLQLLLSACQNNMKVTNCLKLLFDSTGRSGSATRLTIKWKKILKPMCAQMLFVIIIWDHLNTIFVLNGIYLFEVTFRSALKTGFPCYVRYAILRLHFC